MNLPLPNSLQDAKSSANSNAGLWYDKFFNGWDDALAAVPEGNKADWVKNSANTCGESSALNEQYQRLQCLVTARSGCMRHFKTDGRFVTGLGREHPVENGFAWHHTLGVPYLPGSSLKGVLRAWAREQDVGRADMVRIFGPDDCHTAGVGSVLFFDAIPPTPVCLQADVMTPHYGKYYQDEPARTPPADWHNPVPIPFLVVADAQTFVFALAPRRLNHSQDKQDCETVTRWLEEALAWLGAGAKTALGYGRFKPDQATTETVAEEQRQVREQHEHDAALATRMQNLSPLAQELERKIDSLQLDTDKNAFSAPPFIEDWLEKLEINPTADALKRFCSMVNTHFPGLLENPDKTKGKKNEPAFKTRQRNIAKRLLALNDKKS